MSKRSEIAERVRRGQPLDHIPVVDFHAHLGASSDYYYIPDHDPGHVIPYLDRYGVDHIVTFCISVTSDPQPQNRLFYRMSRAHPARISALTCLHAGFPQDWRGLLEEGARSGSRGIKLISQYQGVDETQVDWAPAFDFARDKGWAVLHHSWGPPERLDRWAASYPEIIFIAGHATTLYSDVIKRRENVYQCTCAAFVASVFGSVESMVQALPAEKILHGSDALDLDLGTSIGPIAYADIPEATKELILGGNAVRIMKQLGWRIPGRLLER